MQDQRRSKKNVDASEMKQKRLESKFEFSKNKREENLIKKRQVTDDVGPAQRDAVLEAKVRELFLSDLRASAASICVPSAEEPAANGRWRFL